MSFFDRIFGGSNNDLPPQPDIRFGRYSDSYKEAANYEFWDLSLEKFEKEEYLESYRAFFRYLRDDSEDNVKYEEKDGRIDFEIYQGSKKITGHVDETRLWAESKIARYGVLNVGFMRRLMEQNFGLEYSRFALDGENNITIVFDSYTLDGSPYKLYYALKEVATRADKQDDLLLDEFKMLQPVDTSHLAHLPEPEKEAKYNFLTKEIGKVLDEVENGKLDKDQYPGGIAYLLLNLIYKLDYLVKPEGYMMETMERLHRVYFAKDDKSTAKKNLTFCKNLKKLKDRPREAFFKEMYRVTATFGITTPVNHDRVVSFIDGELNNMDWYRDNGHTEVALAIPGYIVGYCLFNYAVPKPDRDLFNLYFQVMEHEYFQSLGFTLNHYDESEQRFNKKSIKKAIDRIVEQNKAKYPKLYPIIGTLKFDSPAEFAKSYLLMVRNLDVTKVD